MVLSISPRCFRIARYGEALQGEIARDRVRFGQLGDEALSSRIFGPARLVIHFAQDGLAIVAEPSHSDCRECVHVGTTADEVINERIGAPMFRFVNSSGVVTFHALFVVRDQPRPPYRWMQWVSYDREHELTAETGGSLARDWTASSIAKYRVSQQEAVGASQASRRLRALADQLETLVDSEPAEERIQEFLTEHPQLLTPTGKVQPKVPLGSEYETDFAYEQGPGEWTLVEIERPSHALFRRRSTELRAEVNHAITQVRDWQQWIDDYRDYAQQRFPGVSRPDGMVVIGRSGGLSGDQHRRLTHLNTEQRPRVAIWTYDDLLDQARRVASTMENLEPPGDANGQANTT